MWPKRKKGKTGRTKGRLAALRPGGSPVPDPEDGVDGTDGTVYNREPQEGPGVQSQPAADDPISGVWKKQVLNNYKKNPRDSHNLLLKVPTGKAALEATARQKEEVIKLEMVKVVDKMFDNFQNTAYEFNKVTGGSDLELSWIRPSFSTEDASVWHQTSKANVEVFSGRISTRYWTLLVRGTILGVNAYILPSDKILYFTMNPKQFGCYCEIVPQSDGMSVKWFISGRDIDQDLLPSVYRALLDGLIRFANEEAVENERFSLQHIGFVPEPPKAPSQSFVQSAQMSASSSDLRHSGRHELLRPEDEFEFEKPNRETFSDRFIKGITSQVAAEAQSEAERLRQSISLSADNSNRDLLKPAENARTDSSIFRSAGGALPVEDARAQSPQLGNGEEGGWKSISSSTTPSKMSDWQKYMASSRSQIPPASPPKQEEEKWNTVPGTQQLYTGSKRDSHDSRVQSTTIGSLNTNQPPVQSSGSISAENARADNAFQEINYSTAPPAVPPAPGYGGMPQQNLPPGMYPGMQQPGMYPGMPSGMHPGMYPGMQQPGTYPGMQQPGMQQPMNLGYQAGGHPQQPMHPGFQTGGQPQQPIHPGFQTGGYPQQAMHPDFQTEGHPQQPPGGMQLGMQQPGMHPGLPHGGIPNQGMPMPSHMVPDGQQANQNPQDTSGRYHSGPYGSIHGHSIHDPRAFKPPEPALEEHVPYLLSEADFEDERQQRFRAEEAPAYEESEQAETSEEPVAEERYEPAAYSHEQIYLGEESVAEPTVQEPAAELTQELESLSISGVSANIGGVSAYALEQTETPEISQPDEQALAQQIVEHAEPQVFEGAEQQAFDSGEAIEGVEQETFEGAEQQAFESVEQQTIDAELEQVSEGSEGVEPQADKSVDAVVEQQAVAEQETIAPAESWRSQVQSSVPEVNAIGRVESQVPQWMGPLPEKQALGETEAPAETQVPAPKISPIPTGFPDQSWVGLKAMSPAKPTAFEARQRQSSPGGHRYDVDPDLYDSLSVVLATIDVQIEKLTEQGTKAFSARDFRRAEAIIKLSERLTGFKAEAQAIIETLDQDEV